MNYYFAPVQGHTDAAYRDLHSSLYGGSATTYFTPFIRLEHGALRKKDLKEAESALDGEADCIAQVIFRDETELIGLVETLKESGHRRLDINMGCPFPLQTSRGRGAATIANPACAAALCRVVEENPDIEFSVKMRLGLTDPDEWRKLMPTLNDLRLHHVAIHPRVSADQYSAPLRMETYAELLGASSNPVVYSGEILTPDDAAALQAQYPKTAGIMIGRGALGRPSLIAECCEGSEWLKEKRLETMMVFHDALLDHYRESLVGGDHQVLDKIRPFWEYAEAEIGRKSWKAIRKASNMAKYETAVASIDI